VAISLVAARLLQAARDELRGNVKFMFQPAEEGPGGALPMIREGLLVRPKVDAALALHMWNDLPVGTVGVRAGPVFAAVDEFILTVRGRGGHGAAPHQTVDPVVIAAQIVTALQSIVSRKISPLDPSVITVGKIEAGTKFNVIPDVAKLYGTVRSFRAGVRGQLRRWIHRTARGICASFGAECDLKYEHLYPATINDASVCAAVREAASVVVGARRVVEQEQTMGAEDMSYVLARVPGCYLMLGSRNPAKGLTSPHHSARFNFDEDALPIGVEVLIRSAMRLTDGAGAGG
jgi:amidohydrolase